MKNFIVFWSAYCLLVCGCRSNVKGPVNAGIAEPGTGYAFHQPDAIWQLPSSLSEISGIGILNDSVIVCQEDENGILYLYNLLSKQVDQTISFGKQNDYEDLAIVGDDIYVVQSNGNIFQVADYLRSPVTTKFKTFLTGKNDTEGLCFDQATGALLITCKESQDLAEPASAAKMIYSFSLQDKIMSPKPLLLFDEPEFAPTALAVHPVTGNIFVLSSKKRKLLELERDGSRVNLYDLKGKLFIQPEGLAIAANGDIYVSNEGNGGSANILLFKIKK